MSEKNKQIKKENIFYLILSASLFFISCVCSFHVTASVAGTLSELKREPSTTETPTEVNLQAIEKLAELPEPTISESQESLESNEPKLNKIESESFTSETTTFEEEPQSTTELNDIAILSEEYTEIIPYDEETTEIVETTTIDSGETELIYIEEDTDGKNWRYKLSAAEVELVAIVAMLEDSGAMEAISEVILNRVESDKFFGDTVKDVIYAKNQFYVTKRINKNITASEEATEAVLAVFRDGVSVVGCAEFFAEKSVNSKRIANGLYLIASIGDTNFYGQK